MKVAAKSNANLPDESGSENTGLTPGNTYEVVCMDDMSYRIIDDDGQPYLYQKTLFTIIDPQIPNEWIRNEYEDSEWYFGPPEFDKIGFFEDYFDNIEYAVKQFEALRKT